MKNSRQTIQFMITLLAGAAVISLVLFFTSPARKTSGETDSLPVTLFDRATGAFSSATVTGAAVSYTVTSVDGVYSCSSLEGLPQSQSALEKFAGQCTSLTADGLVNRSASTGSHQTDYGFSSPTVTVSVRYTDAGDTVIEVGRQTGDGRYYIRVDKSNSIYVASEDSIHCFLCSISEYLDLSFAPSGVGSGVLPGSITLKQNGNTVTVSRLDAAESDGLGNTYQYCLLDENGNRTWYVDPESYQSYFGDLMTLSADSVVALYPTTDELTEYGIVSRDDSSGITSLSYTVLGTQVRLTISRKTGDYYYIFKQGVPAIYRMPAILASWDGATGYTLMSRSVMAPLQRKISRIMISGGGKQYEFILEHGYYTFNGSPLTRTTFDSFYSLLCSLKAEYEVTGTVQNILPDMTITWVTADTDAVTGEPLTETIRFIPYGTRRYAIEIGGRAQFAVRAAYVQRILDVLGSLQDGQTFSTGW